MDLLTYQLAHEQSRIKAAYMAYASGNVSAAVDFMAGLAQMLGIQIPRRPLASRPSPGKSAVDTNKALIQYFHTLDKLVSKHLGRSIGEIRAQYGMPFKLKAKASKEGPKQ